MRMRMRMRARRLFPCPRPRPCPCPRPCRRLQYRLTRDLFATWTSTWTWTGTGRRLGHRFLHPVPGPALSGPFSLSLALRFSYQHRQYKTSVSGMSYVLYRIDYYQYNISIYLFFGIFILIDSRVRSTLAANKNWVRLVAFSASSL